jgi:hypothetical protein
MNEEFTPAEILKFQRALERTIGDENALLALLNLFPHVTRRDLPEGVAITQRISALVDVADQHGLLNELLLGACAYRPGTGDFLELAAQKGLDDFYLNQPAYEVDLYFCKPPDVAPEWACKLQADVRRQVILSLGHLIVLRDNTSLPPTPVEKAGIMVVILAPGLSDATGEMARCEVERFLAAGGPGSESRLFIARYRDVPVEARQPEALRRLEAFFADLPGLTGINERTDLARDIATRLEALRADQLLPDLQPSPAAPPPSAPRTVFLAESPEEREPTRQRFLRWLRQERINVVPRGRYWPRDPDSLQQAIRQDMEQADLFVQLLPRNTLEAESVGLQYQIARAMSDRLVRVLRWQDRSEANPSLRDAVPEGLEAFRSEVVTLALCKDDDSVAKGIDAVVRGEIERDTEELRFRLSERNGQTREVGDADRPMVAEPEAHAGRNGGGQPDCFGTSIVLQFHRDDAPWVERVLAGPLYRMGALLYKEAAGETEQSLLAARVRQSEALFLVYGRDSTFEWALGQLRECTKALPDAGASLLIQPQLCDAPPEEKPDLGFEHYAWNRVYCREDEDCLQPILAELCAAAAQRRAAGARANGDAPARAGQTVGVWQRRTRKSLEELDDATLRQYLAAQLGRDEIGIVWFDTLGSDMDEDIPGRSRDACIMKLISRAGREGRREAMHQSIRRLLSDRQMNGVGGTPS